jgi:ABC-type multidrug transport system ATPase subunit
MADAGLSFKDLTVVSSNPHKVILNKVSGYVQKGGITAVMGPSASGKSVLLQTLSGRIQDLVISGDVFINGRKVNPKSTHNPIAYVPQVSITTH